MFFNFIFIYYGQEQKTPFASKIKRWERVLHKQTNYFKGKKPSEKRHSKRLYTKLQNPSELVAYFQPLMYMKMEFPETYKEYISNKREVFLKLAHVYSKKPNIERGCFADFICSFPEVVAGAEDEISAILTSYIEGSSLHSRANVLRAVCAVGNSQGVTNVLRTVSGNSLFMHNHLMTNILSSFNGDKLELCKHLWHESQAWNDNVKVSVIQFIAKHSGDYKEEFLPVLRDPKTNVEVRTAIIRYYGRYPHDPVHTTLLNFIPNFESVNLMIRSTSALALYPEDDTAIALKAALYDTNWYVRYNASASLVQLYDEVGLREMLRNETKHAREIVEYLLEREALFVKTAAQEDVIDSAMAPIRI